MLHYAVAFLVIAIMAALLGFGGIAAASAVFAKILFFVCISLSFVSLVAGVSSAVFHGGGRARD